MRVGYFFPPSDCPRFVSHAFLCPLLFFPFARGSVRGVFGRGLELEVFGFLGAIFSLLKRLVGTGAVFAFGQAEVLGCGSLRDWFGWLPQHEHRMPTALRRTDFLTSGNAVARLRSYHCLFSARLGLLSSNCS